MKAPLDNANSNPRSKEDADRVVAFLLDYSSRSGIPVDVLLSVYLVIGRDIIFVLSLFQGMDVRFPDIGALDNAVLREVYPSGTYTDGKGEMLGRDIASGQLLVLDGELGRCLCRPSEMLGRTYVLWRREHDAV